MHANRYTGGEGIFDVPAQSPHSIVDGMTVGAEMLGQIFGRASNVANRMKRDSGLIDALFFGCRPSAIAWAVTAVVVDTVDRVFLGRLVSHVFEEVFEGFKPSCADCDTSRAVTLKIVSARIRAAFTDVAPRLEFRRARHAVSNGPFAKLFNAKASAGPRGTRFKISAVNQLVSAAIAATEVFRMLRIALRLAVLNHSESPKPLTASESWHDGSLPYFALCIGEMS